METIVLDLPKNTTLGEFQLRNGHYITFDEYLEMNIEGVYLEWVDGIVIGFMANNLQHQEIIGFLLMTMKLFAETHDAGRVVQAGYAMKLEKLKRGREPDLVFVSKAHRKMLKHKYLDGAADIAVEIVSPESTVRDREIKFKEYEKAGISEYWLIDPQEKRADFYRLNEKDIYQAVNLKNENFQSLSLNGFSLRVEWLWQEPPPTLAALKELNLI